MMIPWLVIEIGIWEEFVNSFVTGEKHFVSGNWESVLCGTQWPVVYSTVILMLIKCIEYYYYLVVSKCDFSSVTVTTDQFMSKVLAGTENWNIF